jgi:N-acetylmuramoyl-L-alanine amidase
VDDHSSETAAVAPEHQPHPDCHLSGARGDLLHVVEEAMIIKDNWLYTDLGHAKVENYPAIYHGWPGKIFDPRYIIVHYTAGNQISSTINWFAHDKRSNSSAHIVIGEDGRVVQFVPFNDFAWHAGAKWNGLTNMNWYSIGIELVNVGFLRSGFPVPQERQLSAVHPNEKIARVWETYPQAQIDALIEVGRLLTKTYPYIHDVLGHSDVDPKNRLDPGPAFPMGVVREAIFLPFATTPPKTWKQSLTEWARTRGYDGPDPE